MSDKTTYVEYELSGCEPPLDVSGRMIQDGDWIVYARSLGTTTALAFGRAYPVEAQRVAKDQDKPVNRWTNKKAVPVAVITAERKDFGKATLTVYKQNALVIDKSAVPEHIRERLDFSRDELRAKMKVQAADAKRATAEWREKYKAEQEAALAAKGCK